MRAQVLDRGACVKPSDSSFCDPVRPVTTSIQMAGITADPESSALLWRGSLLPLDCEAVPNPATVICQKYRRYRIYDCFAAEREQAPSPQVISDSHAG
ncbi:hypothetical protein C3E98_009750 [Pseudomonas sp. MWU13-2625]|nr:hypothetical protein C3E98_009750 [Pseudomonas sp. MWU13-2625]